MKKRSVIVIFFVICSITITAQNTDFLATLPQAEALLKALFFKVSPNNSDEKNILVNDSISVVLEETLKLPGSFEYPFNDLKYLGKITSEDKKVRVFTWNLSLKDATNRYYGFILYKAGSNNILTYKLSDSSNEIREPATANLDAENWYGCLIYEIIESRHSGETLYTLLGFDPESPLISRKLIDIVWFDNNKPVFGKPVFNYNKKLQSRIIFEYQARVQMMLKWNKAMGMIVFDHLSPSNPAYKGNPRFYGPDGSHDGLKFNKGIWELHESIDVRNNNQ